MPRRNRCCQPADLISTDPANALALGADGNLFVPAGGVASPPIYRAIFEVAPSSEPIVTVLENTTGHTFTWVRDSANYWYAEMDWLPAEEGLNTQIFVLNGSRRFTARAQVLFYVDFNNLVIESATGDLVDKMGIEAMFYV